MFRGVWWPQGLGCLGGLACLGFRAFKGCGFRVLWASVCDSGVL